MEVVEKNESGEYVPRKIMKENLIKELILKGFSQSEIIEKIKDRFGRGVSPNTVVKIRRTLESPQPAVSSFHKKLSRQFYRLFDEMRQHLINYGIITVQDFMDLVNRHIDVEILNKLIEEIKNE